MTDAPSCGLIDGFSIGSVSNLFRDENFRFVMRYIEAFSISLSLSRSLSLALSLSLRFLVLQTASFPIIRIHFRSIGYLPEFLWPLGSDSSRWFNEVRDNVSDISITRALREIITVHYLRPREKRCRIDPIVASR